MSRPPSFALTALAAVFCVCLVVSNIIAGKLYAGPFGSVLAGGVFVFPIVYIIGDVVPEVYGLGAARRIILLGFACNLLAVFFFLTLLALPYPPFWTNQDAFVTVLGFTPRLLIASMCAYLIGTNVNAWVMVVMKRLTNSRYLWTRTISSTILGESLDSLVFVLVAFLGVVPLPALPTMIVSAAVAKIAYETLATPLTYAVVAWFKRLEGIVDTSPPLEQVSPHQAW